MASTKQISKAAAAALAEALTSSGAYVAGELTIAYPLNATTVRDLIEALSDVTSVEWEGESGVPYRSYRGTLPSGLRLDIITDRDFVENIDV